MQWVWVIFGIILMVAEIILPGAIVVFLGLAALIVAACLYFGLITGWIEAFTLWFIASLLLIMILRSLFQKLMQGDVEKQNTDEDLDAFGSLVEVIEKIEPSQDGRINFRGSSWKAKCYDQVLLPGTQAKIISRDDITWIVEPFERIDAS